MELDDASVRERVFHDLDQMTRAGDGSVTWDQLLGYSIDGESLPLIDRSRGIRNPQRLAATLSVVSSSSGPYPDREIMPGVWEYAFRSGGAGGDNAKLIAAHDLGVDIVLFHKQTPKVYLPVFPVRVVSVNRARESVTLALSPLATMNVDQPSAVERAWADTITRRRVHQPAFRSMVLRAYEVQCTVCRFRHAELLDAAHIIADRDAWGEASVTNGLSMCKIHHAAYDANFLGVTPDYEIQINANLLEEVDGPMLQHGLKDMHGMRLTLPTRASDRPDRDRLARRFAEFSNRPA